MQTHDQHPDQSRSRETGMGYFSGDEYEGNASDEYSSPPQFRSPNQGRSKRRAKQEPDDIAFDSAALGNAAAVPYYQPHPIYHFGMSSSGLN